VSITMPRGTVRLLRAAPTVQPDAAVTGLLTEWQAWASAVVGIRVRRWRRGKRNGVSGVEEKIERLSRTLRREERHQRDSHPSFPARTMAMAGMRVGHVASVYAEGCCVQLRGK
jgi:hypothetical protein